MSAARAAMLPLAAMALAVPAYATDGLWITDGNGIWSDTANWQSGTVADGQDSLADFSASFTASRTVTLDSPRSAGTLRFHDTGAGSNVNLTITGPNALTMDTGSSDQPVIEVILAIPSMLIIQCDLAGSNGFEKRGFGGLQFRGVSKTYSGTTIIKEGVLDFYSTSVDTVGGGPGVQDIIVQDGAGVRFQQLESSNLNRIVPTTDEITLMTGTSSNPINLEPYAATLPNAFLGNWVNNRNKTELSGSITPANDAFRLGSPACFGLLGISSTLVDGDIPRTLTIGGSEVILTAANTFSGETVVADGRLYLGNNFALQNSPLNLGSSGGKLGFSSGEHPFKITGDSLTNAPHFGGLRGSRNFVDVIHTGFAGNNADLIGTSEILGLTLNVGEGVSCEYSGNIGDLATGTSLDKTGPGTQILTGLYDYTGNTTVSGGKLLINSPGNLTLSSDVLVNGSGVLGGDGFCGNNVTVNSLGGLAPGAPVGVMNIGGNLDISAIAGNGNGKLEFDLGVDLASSDSIQVTGGLVISDTGTDKLRFSDFSFNNTGTMQSGTYQLINTAMPITGSIDAANASGSIGRFDLTLQVNSNGNSIEVVVVEQPPTPYQAWAFDQPYGGDLNGDGVANGLAYVLGAATPLDDARTLLPVGSGQDSYTLTFKARNSSFRGQVGLFLQYSSDLGANDSWQTVAVPDMSIEISPVSFSVSPDPANPELNDVVATISATESQATGRIFVRLTTEENPSKPPDEPG